MSFEAFFKAHPLFHHSDLVRYLESLGNFNQNTLKAALQYHLAKNHIARISRGYYLVTSTYLPGIHVENDHLLIAGRIAPDAIISYHTAMEFHALAYSIMPVVYFNSGARIGHLDTEYGRYQQLAHPSALKPRNIFLETKLHDRAGIDIRVASIERTLVDCLHRPELSGGWEEIWRSFESINFLDIEKLINYAVQLGNATTIAKLGFFLEQHADQFSVEEKTLQTLEHLRPKSRHYMDKHDKENAKTLKRWNLIAPLTIIKRMWEELKNDPF